MHVIYQVGQLLLLYSFFFLIQSTYLTTRLGFYTSLVSDSIMLSACHTEAEIEYVYEYTYIHIGLVDLVYLE